MVDRGEIEIEGAKRELFEEVGINCALSDLVFLKEVLSTKSFKKDHQFFYHLRLHDETEIVLDMREVIDFKWASVEDVLQHETPDSVRAIVSEYKAFIFN
jgi:8-oxo-dGTP pyrophosphatase MutT (NUDIX family)